MLRYVPGFTRVESSGGEVNQNISMRGILGMEYVAFLEDGLPVFPTMHTFFMNADNLFRFDENIERLEVVRGGSLGRCSVPTRPGAIVNFINKTGGTEFAGTMRGDRRHPGARAVRSQRWRTVGRGLAVQRGRLLPLRPRGARSRASRASEAASSRQT